MYLQDNLRSLDKFLARSPIFDLTATWCDLCYKKSLNTAAIAASSPACATIANGFGNNILNTAPPPVISGLPGNTTGAETDAGTYDAIGRRYYAGARIRF